MTRDGSRTRRSVAAALVVLGFTAGITVMTAAPALAEGCSAGGALCGAVRNNADHTMHYTRALNSKDHVDKCDVWNQNGGNSWSWAQMKCGQRALGKGGSRGGPWSDFDVDAFTFNTHAYQVSFDGGPWRSLNQGVWTKINNVEAATCAMAAGTVRCWIDSAL